MKLIKVLLVVGATLLPSGLIFTHSPDPVQVKKGYKKMMWGGIIAVVALVPTYKGSKALYKKWSELKINNKPTITAGDWILGGSGIVLWSLPIGLFVDGLRDIGAFKNMKHHLKVLKKLKVFKNK